MSAWAACCLPVILANVCRLLSIYLGLTCCAVQQFYEAYANANRIVKISLLSGSLLVCLNSISFLCLDFVFFNLGSVFASANFH